MKKQTNKTMIHYLTALFWCAAALAADQLSKWMAAAYLKDHDPFVLIPEVFELRYLENRGAAFGIFQGRQLVFTIGAIFICLVIVYLYRKIPETSRFIPLRICAVLICAGAIGNMIDRIRLNYVIDFFYFKLIDFPIFNVADCYVVIACILFAYLIFFYYKDEELTCFSLKHR